MPIRFRCAYCNQLMGISSRKAGTVVRCPKCAGEIIVPTPEGTEAAPEQPEPPAAAGPQAFEDPNFEQNLSVPTAGKDDATATANAGAFPGMPPPLDLPAPPEPPPKRIGVFVPLGMLIVSFAVIVLLLILVFVLGLVIGRHSIVVDTRTALLACVC